MVEPFLQDINVFPDLNYHHILPLDEDIDKELCLEVEQEDDKEAIEYFTLLKK